MRDNKDLYAIAAKMMEKGKGILAADESTKSANKLRLELVGVEGTAENRRRFREILFTAPNVEQYLSGVILYEETLHNTTKEGDLFPDILISRGIVPGIKVDKGLRPLFNFEGDKVTQGLDDLYERMEEYHGLGCRFAKWRAALQISNNTPSMEAVRINSVMLARYASICQEAGVVPMVEPEVLFDGAHDIARAEEVTTDVLKVLMDTLLEYRVDLKGVILKSSMVLAGKAHEKVSTPEEVAAATLRTFAASVPAEVAGIVFLSGGQEAERATENLNVIAQKNTGPWPITFSYSRAIQMPMLEAWRGDEQNVSEAQKVLLAMCAANAEASLGRYQGK
jgi:fructose-bisphosphate aldolase, class I